MIIATLLTACLLINCLSIVAQDNGIQIIWNDILKNDNKINNSSQEKPFDEVIDLEDKHELKRVISWMLQRGHEQLTIQELKKASDPQETDNSSDLPLDISVKNEMQRLVYWVLERSYRQEIVIQELQSKDSEQERIIQELRETIGQHPGEAFDLANDGAQSARAAILDLATAVTGMQLRLIQQQQTIYKLGTTVDELQNRNSEQLRLINELQKTIAELQSNETQHQQILESHERAIEVLDNITAVQAVGFTAYATDRSNYIGDIMLFDEVVNNYGDHYDSSTGRFTCPYNGIYVFFVTLISKSFAMDAYITHEGRILVATMVGYDRKGSVMAVVNCNSGDRVWVQFRANETIPVEPDEIHYDKWTSFSGFLLKVN